MSADDQESTLREQAVEALLTLANVGYGDLGGHIDVRVPVDTPLGALLTGINEMIDALRDERGRNLAFRAELEDKLATIEAQREAIRELSTPVIEVWSGVLCVPVVGVVDDAQAARMLDVLLAAIVERGTRCAIVDVTGIKEIDAATTGHFVRMARAVRLVGATYVLTGVSPPLARRIIESGADLREIKIFQSLRVALHEHVSGGLARPA
jgi:rsbT co-antagonist protein RsbR